MTKPTRKRVIKKVSRRKMIRSRHCDHLHHREFSKGANRPCNLLQMTPRSATWRDNQNNLHKWLLMEIKHFNKSLRNKKSRTLKASADVVQKRKYQSLTYEGIPHHQANVARKHPQGRRVRSEAAQIIAPCPMRLWLVVLVPNMTNTIPSMVMTMAAQKLK